MESVIEQLLWRARRESNGVGKRAIIMARVARRESNGVGKREIIMASMERVE